MKSIRLLMMVFFSVCLAINAFAASLSYVPDRVDITLEPGFETTIPLTVSSPDVLRGTYLLWFADSVSAGNLPLSWIAPSPSTDFFNRWSPSANTTLTIRVPEGTTPGTYSGYLFSRAAASHEIAGAGTGMFIEVVVPAACIEVPRFEIVSFGPQYLWPPDHGMHEVAVTGKVSVSDGCSLINIGYSISDEYGIYTSDGGFTVSEDGTFELYLPVEASRNGRDKDGRHYSIRLFAEDEAGTEITDVLDVVVPHDQRDKAPK